MSKSGDDANRLRMWDTILAAAWRAGGTFVFAGLLAYFGHSTLALWLLAGNALIYALLALNEVIRLERRFPEAD